ncbi:MAG: hypothetical protein EOP77_04610, partial [Variovorax sp.]
MAASEITKAGGKKSSRAIIASSVLTLFAAPAFALNCGPQSANLLTGAVTTNTTVVADPVTGGAEENCIANGNQGLRFIANSDKNAAGEDMVLAGGGNGGQAIRDFFRGNADIANQANITIGDVGYTASITTIFANRFQVGSSTTSASGANSSAIGVGAKASAADTVAIGSNAVASGASAVALGNGAQARYTTGVALGSGSLTGTAAPTAAAFATGQAAPIGEVAVGGGTAATNRRITNMADGAALTDGVTVAQLSTTTSSLSTGVSSLSTSTSTGITSLSTGVSTTNSNVTSLSTSTSTGLSTAASRDTSLSTGISSLSTSTSTGIGSLSTGLSSTTSGITSLSTGLSTTNGNVTSLSTSTSTGIGSL